jgi:hypothetical protein
MKTFLPARITRCILLISSVALPGLPGLLMGTLATSAKVTGLECPEIGRTGVPDLTSDSSRAKLLVSGSSADLANEVSELINQVQLKEPSISNADLTNGLIAAYCPLVAQAPALTSAQRWSQIHRFEKAVQQQLSEMPPGSMIVGNVPLPPAVCRRLRSQAEAAGQTPAQLMGSILTAAAGKEELK